ncbi:MAG: HupE/UreJ family protein, partial [Woeseiaceae bacterium]
MAFLVILCMPTLVLAHALGIDKGDLIDKGGASYELISRVPQRLMHLIAAPDLPDHCRLTGDSRGTRGSYQVLYAFTCERPLTADDTLALPWQREGVMLTVRWKGERPVTRLLKREGAAIPVKLADYKASSGSLLNAAKRYTQLGIEHILLGFDHLLFVFGLLLLVKRGWPLVKTITSFTVAHSITLGLATIGLVEIPVAPVEAIIALSIVFVAVEVVHAHQGRLGLAARFPWIVAFSFGLLHGFGFAGALSEIGLPQAEIPIALVFFNIGVEIGQLVFVMFALLPIWMIGLLRVKWPRWSEVLPAYAIGTLAMFWFAERTLPIFTDVSTPF